MPRADRLTRAPASPQARPAARCRLVGARLTEAQLADLRRAADLLGLPPSRAATIAVVRWTLAVLAEHGEANR